MSVHYRKPACWGVPPPLSSHSNILGVWLHKAHESLPLVSQAAWVCVSLEKKIDLRCLSLPSILPFLRFLLLLTQHLLTYLVGHLFLFPSFLVSNSPQRFGQRVDKESLALLWEVDSMYSLQCSMHKLGPGGIKAKFLSLTSAVQWCVDWCWSEEAISGPQAFSLNQWDKGNPTWAIMPLTLSYRAAPSLWGCIGHITGARRAEQQGGIVERLVKPQIPKSKLPMSSKPT